MYTHKITLNIHEISKPKLKADIKYKGHQTCVAIVITFCVAAVYKHVHVYCICKELLKAGVLEL